GGRADGVAARPGTASAEVGRRPAGTGPRAQRSRRLRRVLPRLAPARDAPPPGLTRAFAAWSASPSAGPPGPGPPPPPFPPPAPRAGRGAGGGALAPAPPRLAYEQGIFPWPVQGLPLLWFSPAERGVLEFAALRVPRSLARARRKDPFRLTVDADFPGVIRA